MLWVEAPLSWGSPCEALGDDEVHLGCDVQTDGVQPISWIETAVGDIGEIRTRGEGLGYMPRLV
jgi:hypothetical protein